MITGPERRRRWSDEQKRAIVGGVFAPGAVVSEVARRADVSSGEIYRWRQEFRAAAAGFAQVLIVLAESPTPTTANGVMSSAEPAIEIEFAGKGPRSHTGVGSGGIGGGRRQGSVAATIPIPSGVRMWLAVGHTDVRRGMNSLAVQVQEVLGRDPHADDLYVFRGKRGHLIKILWHDGIGMSLYAKRLERGRFIWPSPADGMVAITAAQLAYMLDGIDRRNPVRT